MNFFDDANLHTGIDDQEITWPYILEWILAAERCNARVWFLLVKTGMSAVTECREA